MKREDKKKRQSAVSGDALHCSGTATATINAATNATATATTNERHCFVPC